MSVLSRPDFDVLRPPGRGAGLLDVVRRRDLAVLLVRKELRVRYRGSVLGLAWSYVKPAVQLAVYYFGLGVVLGQGSRVPHYAVYLFAGLVAVNAFSEVVGNATRSVVANADLVRKVYLPRELFPVSSLCVAGVHLLPQLLVLTAGALVAGWRPDAAGVLSAVGAVLLVAGFGLGLGLVLSALNVFFRDVENLVDLVLSVVVWTSPVLYATERVVRLLGEGPLLSAYLSNPLTVAVQLMHRAFWEGAAGVRGTGPDAAHLAAATVVVVAVLCVGQWTFARLSPRFGEQL
ncbi:ABC transporter permease [Angustibacter luteus]|uniref:Transport permease protein n=1 Tax=Angustibacter luteus TaxID=658456 RepID=A0ABW1JCF6_9ACTN